MDIPITASHPKIEQIGKKCRVSSTVSIWRRGKMDASNPLISLGSGVVIFDYVRMVVSDRSETKHAGIRLGNRVMVNSGSFLSGEGGLIIEDEVLIGPHVKILTAGHEIDGEKESIYQNKITYEPVYIESGAWLGAGSTITQGCRIGKGAVISAGAVVTHDVPSFAVVMGVPARIKRFRKIVNQYNNNLNQTPEKK